MRQVFKRAATAALWMASSAFAEPLLIGRAPMIIEPPQVEELFCGHLHQSNYIPNVMGAELSEPIESQPYTPSTPSQTEMRARSLASISLSEIAPTDKKATDLGVSLYKTTPHNFNQLEVRGGVSELSRKATAGLEMRLYW